MSVTEKSVSNRDAPIPVNGDVVGGGLLAVLALLHLFVLQIGGTIGVVLLLVVWPLIGGAVGTYFNNEYRPERQRDLAVVGAVAGVFGTATIGIVLLLSGFAGLWSPFVFDFFGSQLAPVVIGATVLFALTWTVFGYVGGYVAREALN